MTIQPWNERKVAMIEAMQAEIDELRAELKKIKQQEPCQWLVFDPSYGRYGGHRVCQTLPLEVGAFPVFLAPGAQPDGAKDAARFRWLTDDLSASMGRVQRNEIISRMAVMSYSSACTDIDVAMLEAAKDKPCTAHNQ